ncbi:hypothetical protein [Azohydromonas australica]|uniref:hypothetical protein n=1 Tax=Azohydromonas australica TaxID=364039 RepID=UPI000410320F|nr:hypothetical protein [Azohydromonas australica]
MDSPKPKPTAKSNKERQEALRQRREEQGMTELRGLYAPTELHAEIKQRIRHWLKSRR